MKCDYCGQPIELGEEYIYHTKSDFNFCNNECANDVAITDDEQYRQTKVNGEEEEEDE